MKRQKILEPLSDLMWDSVPDREYTEQELHEAAYDGDPDELDLDSWEQLQ